MKVKLLTTGSYPEMGIDPCIGKEVEAHFFHRGRLSDSILITFEELMRVGFENPMRFNPKDTLDFMNFSRYGKEHKEFEVVQE